MNVRLVLSISSPCREIQCADIVHLTRPCRHIPSENLSGNTTLASAAISDTVRGRTPVVAAKKLHIVAVGGYCWDMTERRLHNMKPVCALLGMFMCISAHGKDWHVSQKALPGIDTGDQVRSIGEAVAHLNAGDTIIIHGGIYREQVTVDKNGTAEEPITIRAATGELVVVTGAEHLTDWQRDDGDALVFWTDWPHEFISWNEHNTHPSDDYHRLIGRCEQVFVDGWFDINDERHWPKSMQEGLSSRQSKADDSPTDGPPDGLELKDLELTFEKNLYRPGLGQGLFNWGVTWKMHRKYADLDAMRRELAFEQTGRLAGIAFRDFGRLDLRVPADSPAVEMRCYPEADVPRVKLGTYAR
jgi:hypothetical protein